MLHAACCPPRATTPEHITQPLRNDGGAPVHQVAGPAWPGTISFRPGISIGRCTELCGASSPRYLQTKHARVLIFYSYPASWTYSQVRHRRVPPRIRHASVRAAPSRPMSRHACWQAAPSKRLLRHSTSAPRHAMRPSEMRPPCSAPPRTRCLRCPLLSSPFGFMSGFSWATPAVSVGMTGSY